MRQEHTASEAREHILLHFASRLDQVAARVKEDLTKPTVATFGVLGKSMPDALVVCDKLLGQITRSLCHAEKEGRLPTYHGMTTAKGKRGDVWLCPALYPTENLAAPERDQQKKFSCTHGSPAWGFHPRESRQHPPNHLSPLGRRSVTGCNSDGCKASNTTIKYMICGHSICVGCGSTCKVCLESAGNAMKKTGETERNTEARRIIRVEELRMTKQDDEDESEVAMDMVVDDDGDMIDVVAAVAGAGGAGPGAGAAGPGSGAVGPGSGAVGPGSGAVGPGSGAAGPGSGAAGPGSGAVGPGSGAVGPGSGAVGPGSGAAITGRGARTGFGAGAKAGRKLGGGQRAGDKKSARQKANQARLASSLEDVRKIVSETPRPCPPSSTPGRASESGANEPRSKRLGSSTASTPAKSGKSAKPNGTRQKKE